MATTNQFDPEIVEEAAQKLLDTFLDLMNDHICEIASQTKLVPNEDDIDTFLKAQDAILKRMGELLSNGGGS